MLLPTHSIEVEDSEEDLLRLVASTSEKLSQLFLRAVFVLVIASIMD